MSNLDAPKGIRAITNANGNHPRMHEYMVANSTTIYEGQSVGLNTDGRVAAYGVGSTLAAKRFLGGAVESKTAANSNRKIRVYDEPDTEFEAQMDGADVTNIGGLIGRNFGIVNLSSGSDTTMQSIAEIDSSSGTRTVNDGATTWFPVKGLRFASDAENDVSTTWSRVIVKINPRCHIFSAEDTGV